MAAACTCSTPDPDVTAEGIVYCRECGERVTNPDPRDKLRDKLLILVARKQEEILSRLARIEDDRKLIEPAELARRLGKSREWVYDHRDELGVIRVGDGPRPRLLFDPAIARERLEARSARNGSSPSKPKARNRKRRSSANVELLPIGRRSE